jgi:hypothetical protein
MQRLTAYPAGGIYFEKHSFSGSTRLFAAPFFHLLRLDYICFGPCLPPEMPSRRSLFHLQCIDFYDFFSFRNLPLQNRNLLCKVTKKIPVVKKPIWLIK